MISINNLSFYFGSRPLYYETSLHIKPKDRIGLIGANGTGKSTLLRMITGEYTPDEGTISRSGECTIGFLNQDLLSYQTQDSILSVAMQAFERQNELSQLIEELLVKIETDYDEKTLERLAAYQDEFGTLDGYSIQAKAEEILEGLGFATKDLHRPLSEFSGGWRMRVMLAKLLLMKPSLLMLDEPTNHLDLPSIQWIEQYLINYEGAIICVSHDRQFLDNTVTSIVEVSGGKLNQYSGNFSFYLGEKALRKEIQKGAYENQQSQIKQTEKFIERFRSKASKANQVQSRVKALERLDLIEEVEEDVIKLNFKFNFKIQPGRNISTLENVSKAYGEQIILKNSSGQVERGDKIALIGANGKGKSTLLRIIANEEKIEGETVLGHNVRATFYAQHQLESLTLENTILEEMKGSGSSKTEVELRAVLGCFLFSNDDVFKKIKVLSGGEKSRVALAKTLISEANFLLLDEPTNHLDMTSVNVLIQALQQYEGSYVVVSHDRHFVTHIANKIWYIEDNKIKEYPGTYEEYETWNKSRVQQNTVPEPIVKKKAEQAPIIRVNDDEKKLIQKNLKSLYQKLGLIEKEIEEKETEKNRLENLLADTSIYANAGKLADTNTAYDQISKQLSAAQEQWETIAFDIENLESKLK